MLDPRIAQILILASLASYGISSDLFGFSFLNLVVSILSTIFCQWVCSVYVRARFEWRSPLISGISLGLLLRADNLWLVVVAGALSILSKFFIRFRDKHIFNPTNFGITVLLIVSAFWDATGVWVSPGQWGSEVVLAFLLFCAGNFVVYRAERNDVTWAFLAAYSAMLFGRAFYLGDPFSITLHQLESGALVIFAFFMISDPKTTPDTRAGRILFAISVAVLSYILRFKYYLPEAVFYALFFCSAFVPLLDLVFPGVRYHWESSKERLSFGRKRLVFY